MGLRYSSGAVKAISTALAEKRASYEGKLKLEDVEEPVNEASPQVQEIIVRILQLEKDKLYMKTPRFINDDILKIIKDVVQ